MHKWRNYFGLTSKEKYRMKIQTRRLVIGILFSIVLTIFAGCGRDEIDIHDEYETEAEHADHDESRKEHGDEGHLELTNEAIRMAGIQFDKVKMGRIKKFIELSGEVGLNEDRVVHVVPRFPGIVRSVEKALGDHVKADEVLAVVESNESLSRYKITSSMKGTVIEKHITPGEYVADNASVYVIADLSNIWVNLSIYAKDIQDICQGTEVEITLIGHNLSTTGKISYISSVFNKTSRIAKARVVLPNPQLRWRSGMFVRGMIRLESSQRAVVKTEALQTLHETTVIFVRKKRNEFGHVPVVTGKSDGQWTEIIKGLKFNDEYVSNGAFELKAQVVTGSLGGHAGHGH